MRHQMNSKPIKHFIFMFDEMFEENSNVWWWTGLLVNISSSFSATVLKRLKWDGSRHRFNIWINQSDRLKVLLLSRRFCKRIIEGCSPFGYGFSAWTSVYLESVFLFLSLWRNIGKVSMVSKLVWWNRIFGWLILIKRVWWSLIVHSFAF